MHGLSEVLQSNVNQIVLTTGHARKVRPELYSRPWSSNCDFRLVGDLMEACHVRDLDGQGTELKRYMQAGHCNTAAYALEHPWLT